MKLPTENDIATTRGLHQSGKITRQTPVNYLCVKLNVDLVFDTFFKENIAKRDFRSEKKNRKKVQNTHRLSKIKENNQSRSEAHPVKRGNYESKNYEGKLNFEGMKEKIWFRKIQKIRGCRVFKRCFQVSCFEKVSIFKKNCISESFRICHCKFMHATQYAIWLLK